MPRKWASPSYDFSAWPAATTFTAEEAGWGLTPTWSKDDGCCTPVSPMTHENLGCCSCNYDEKTDQAVLVDMVKSECLDPQEVLSDGDADFLWSADMIRDNKLLFRYTAPSVQQPAQRPTRTRPTRPCRPGSRNCP